MVGGGVGCVSVYSFSLETSFVYMQKSCFHFQVHHQFCGFFATLAVSFFFF